MQQLAATLRLAAAVGRSTNFDRPLPYPVNLPQFILRVDDLPASWKIRPLNSIVCH